MPGSDSPENLMILKKSQLLVDFGLCRQIIGLSALMADSWVSTVVWRSLSRSWCWEVEFRPWCGEVGVRLWCSEIEIGPQNVPNVTSVVSTIWLRKTFKNCVSLLVSKNRRQKLINRLYLNNGVHFFFCLYLYLPVSVFIYVYVWVYSTYRLSRLSQESNRHLQ